MKTSLSRLNLDKIIKYFLENKFSGTLVTDYERHAMALMALGLNPYNTNNENYIKKITADLKIPFKLDGDKRVDKTSVHDALREALVNTLVHADYSGKASILIVKRPDMFGFRNPGLMRVSVEQAIKAYDAIIELQNVSSKLITTDLEYTEVNVDIGVNIKCGFYQTGVKQGAFLYLGTNQMFLKVAELGCISDFIAAGLEKIDSVLNQIEK